MNTQERKYRGWTWKSFALSTMILVGGPSCVHPTEAPVMAVADGPASPKEEPLPQAQLRVLETYQFSALDYFVHSEGGFSTIRMPIWVGIYSHPTEGLVLIDSGYPSRTGVDPNSYPGLFQQVALGLEAEEGRSVADRLHEIGQTPSDVRHIIITHMHSDHVGGVEDFPEAKIWVHPDELVAFDHGGLFSGYIRETLSQRELHTIDLSKSKPYPPFEESIDLFEDGSLILLPTPGHTAGHMSVLASVPGHTFLFLGDSAWTNRHWQEPSPKSALISIVEEHDWKNNMDVLWRIKSYSQSHPETVIIAGHEENAMAGQRQWPAPYPDTQQ
jgi:N-acyl homoserine lactone hydrolase